MTLQTFKKYASNTRVALGIACGAISVIWILACGKNYELYLRYPLVYKWPMIVGMVCGWLAAWVNLDGDENSDWGKTTPLTKKLLIWMVLVPVGIVIAYMAFGL